MSTTGKLELQEILNRAASDCGLQRKGAKESQQSPERQGAANYLMYASGNVLVAFWISVRTWLASLQPNMGSLYIDQYLQPSEKLRPAYGCEISFKMPQQLSCRTSLETSYPLTNSLQVFRSAISNHDPCQTASRSTAPH